MGLCTYLWCLCSVWGIPFPGRCWQEGRGLKEKHPQNGMVGICQESPGPNHIVNGKAGEDVVCTFIKFPQMCLSGFLCAHSCSVWQRGKTKCGCSCTTRSYSDCRLGLNNFLQSGHSDAEPQTSGMFQRHGTSGNFIEFPKFSPRLDGAWSDLVEWKVFLLMAGGGTG